MTPKPYPGFGLTAKAFSLLAILVATVGIGWLLFYKSFDELEQSLAMIVDRDVEQLMISTRLLQQTEILISTGHKLAYAPTNKDRRRIQMETADRAAWIRRMVDEINELIATEPEQIANIVGILDNLETNFAAIAGLVRQRDPGGDDDDGGYRIVLQADLLDIIDENRRLATDLSISLGFFTANMRENLRRQNEMLAAEIQRNQQIMLLFAAAFCVVVLLVGLYVRVGIVGRILHLRRAVEGTDDTIRPEDVLVGGKDEITQLSATISGYVQRLQADKSELIQARRQAEAATEIKAPFWPT